MKATEDAEKKRLAEIEKVEVLERERDARVQQELEMNGGLYTPAIATADSELWVSGGSANTRTTTQQQQQQLFNKQLLAQQEQQQQQQFMLRTQQQKQQQQLLAQQQAQQQVSDRTNERKWLETLWLHPLLN